MMKQKFNRKEDFDIKIFGTPKPIGYFSLLGEDREYSTKPTNLRYYYERDSRCKPELDLKVGYENFIPKTKMQDNEVKLDSLLQWISQDNTLIELLQKQETTFVCWRGLLKMVMKSPFMEPYQTNDWRVCAVRVKNVIFLCKFCTDYKKQNSYDYENDLSTFGGYKFEQYMLSDHPSHQPDTSKAINANDEFCVIFENKFGTDNIVYGAEVDGVDSSEYIHDDSKRILEAKFIELKTRKVIKKTKVHNFNRFKLLDWWAQSYLFNIKDIICGVKDKKENLLVFQIDKYDTTEIPFKVQGRWNPKDCVSFLHDFLQHVKETMKKEKPFAIIKFDWNATKEELLYGKVAGEEYKIFPNWFENECKKYATGS